MIVRTMTDADVPQATHIHRAMDLGYQMPNLRNPRFRIRLGAFDGGSMKAALFVKIIGETFLLLDPEMTDEAKGRAVVILSREGTLHAEAAGFDEVSAWIPPSIEPSFAPALENLGWMKSPWPTWSKIL